MFQKHMIFEHPYKRRAVFLASHIYCICIDVGVLFFL